MHQAGLIQYAERRSAVQKNRCNIADITKARAAKFSMLGLDEVIGGFVILGVGCSLSVLCCIVEIIVGNIKKRCFNTA